MTDAIIKEVPTSGTDSGFFSGGGPPLRKLMTSTSLHVLVLLLPNTTYYFKKATGLLCLKTGHFYRAFWSEIQHSVIKLTRYINCKGYSFNCLENIICIVHLLICFSFSREHLFWRLSPQLDGVLVKTWNFMKLICTMFLTPCWSFHVVILNVLLLRTK